MVKEQFWDRTCELGKLHQLHQKKTAELVKIYGRRRVGKTELVRHFLAGLDKGTFLYYYTDQAEDPVYLQTMADAIQRQLGDTVALKNWDDFFTYIATKAKERFVLVIDEAPRFMDKNSIFLTRLQHAWGTDPKLETSKIMLILVGSSISMMDRMTDQHGPLHGRITETIKLSPFRYVDFRDVFKNLPEYDKILHYAVFGGTPHYVRSGKNAGKALHDAIMDLIVRPESTLSKEAEDLFKIEGVREPARYVSILKAIAEGKHKLPEIANSTGIQIEQLPTYLSKLDTRLDLVVPADPIGGKKKNARYEVSDNFFRFWFRFVFPHRSAIEIGNTKDIGTLIQTQMNAFAGLVFEQVVRELLILYQGRDILGVPILFDDIGRWWPSRSEQPAGDNGDIDVVARHENSKTTYVADVKFTNEPYGFTEHNTLQERTKKLPFGGHIKLFAVSRSGFTTDFATYAKEHTITLIDMKTLAALFDAA